jgi:hypothetical protein
MKKRLRAWQGRLAALFCAFAFACVVAACGGGGGGSAVAPPMPGSSQTPNPSPSASSFPSPSPTPTGNPSPTPTEAPPPPSAYFPYTWSGLHVFQPFDNFDNKNIISPQQAMMDGPLYDAIWGSNSPQMVQAWQTNNPSILTSAYFPLPTDALTSQFGNLGHDITWWQANHPDWILYECDETTVAYIPGIPEIPLDISNPAAVSYMEQLVGTYAEQGGYSAISVDFVNLNNPTGGKVGTRGCGVWTQNHTVWVQKFSGTYVDPAWASAVLSWTSSFQTYLHGLARPLAFWGNNVPANYRVGDPQESQLIGYLDIVHDEQGYANYGKNSDDGYFNSTVGWAKYIQSQGKGFLIVDIWQSNPLTNAQIEYALATYLMSKEQASALTAVPYRTYGLEHYYQAYKSSTGAPCSEMYGGPSYRGLGYFVYYRQYTGALAVVNTSSSQAYVVNLPQSSYVDAVTGANVTSPLTVGPQAGFALLTPSGCSPLNGLRPHHR